MELPSAHSGTALNRSQRYNGGIRRAWVRKRRQRECVCEPSQDHSSVCVRVCVNTASSGLLIPPSSSSPSSSCVETPCSVAGSLPTSLWERMRSPSGGDSCLCRPAKCRRASLLSAAGVPDRSDVTATLVSTSITGDQDWASSFDPLLALSLHMDLLSSHHQPVCKPVSDSTTNWSQCLQGVTWQRAVGRRRGRPTNSTFTVSFTIPCAFILKVSNEMDLCYTVKRSVLMYNISRLE